MHPVENIMRTTMEQLKEMVVLIMFSTGCILKT